MSTAHRQIASVGPVVPPAGTRALGLDEVVITGGFWSERQDVNGSATLPHIESWLEREGWLANFDLAVEGGLAAGRRGREFSDSEVFKYLEAVAWESARLDHPEEIEAGYLAVVHRVAAAQHPDGYLNTRFGGVGQSERWSDLQWGHELYCLGHLFQAAVARIRTRPDERGGLADVAIRAADLVCDEFGAEGRQAVCGHAEIETALVELSRATGDGRYLEQARIFIERRGHGLLGDIEWGRGYFQDDIPVREASSLRGHAVRANYLASGAVDVAVDTGDDDLLAAIDRQWRHARTCRTYITGGQGSHHQDEAFGDDWELPPDRAYAETCAAVGSIQLAWRLLLARGGSEYGDIIERTLYNVIATSPADDGRSFYYANTLQQRRAGQDADPDAASSRASSSLRAPWFEVACCPPNIARTLASLASYIATADRFGVAIHQYVSARINTTLDDGTEVAIGITTNYPRSGCIRLEIEKAAEFTLTLRIPAWARGATVTLGEETSVPVSPGSVELRRRFETGQVIELQLPLEPRFVRPDPRIDALRGTVAVERGPEVMALESIDVPAGHNEPDLALLFVNDRVAPIDDGGVVRVRLLCGSVAEADWPYQEHTTDDAADEALVALTPYRNWARRGPSTMRVFIPVI